MESGGLFFFLLQIILLLFLGGRCYCSQQDVQCLKQLQKSVKDPDNVLKYGWNFANKTEGFICNFYGVDCWHPDENKVLNLRLTNMNLQGKFPSGLDLCESLTGLDLSNNNFSGPIPENISKMIPYVTSLDLSFNRFSGDIPSNLSNCTYLNVLNLQHNRLTGIIPWQLASLNRLTSLNMADNLLTGEIPAFQHGNFTAANFAGNPGLCGKPLDVCVGPPSKSNTGVIIGSAMGGALAMVLVVGVIIFFCLRNVSVKRKAKVEAENKWAKSLKGLKGVKAS